MPKTNIKKNKQKNENITMQELMRKMSKIAEDNLDKALKIHMEESKKQQQAMRDSFAIISSLLPKFEAFTTIQDERHADLLENARNKVRRVYNATNSMKDRVNTTITSVVNINDAMTKKREAASKKIEFEFKKSIIKLRKKMIPTERDKQKNKKKHAPELQTIDE